MIRLLKITLVFLPTLLAMSIPQTSISHREIWACVFIVFSLLIVFLPKVRHTAVMQSLSDLYSRGLMLTTLVLTFCSFFPVGGFLSQPLMLKHSDSNADAILVLASGATVSGNPGLNGYQRVLHGVKLLKENRAPVLYISTGYHQLYEHAEAGWVASLTEMTKTRPEKLHILVSPRITTTATEAEYATEQMKKNGVRSILLVTSGAHIYRSTLVFKKLGLEVFPAPCHDSESVYDSMGHLLGSLNSVIHEWVGLIYYKLKNYY